MDRISVDGIREAHRLIDPVFKDTPQYPSEPLSRRLGLDVVLKVETLNPIRSFKGRGTDYLLHRITPPAAGIVCASAGNFGQGIAYAGRKHGVPVNVFAAENANPLKVERMRALGAEVVLEGEDFDAAKTGARRRAAETGAMFVEDGTLAPIAEGAGTIALELCRLDPPLDVLLVPLGDGALISGAGTWLRVHSPSTKVVGVVAEGAPALALSWREGRTVSTSTAATIADGIAVREPVEGALESLTGRVDDIVVVSDEEILEAMRMLMSDAGLVVEPAGAAALAGALHRRYEGQRAGVIVSGGNITPEQIRGWLLS